MTPAEEKARIAAAQVAYLRRIYPAAIVDRHLADLERRRQRLGKTREHDDDDVA